MPSPVRGPDAGPPARRWGAPRRVRRRRPARRRSARRPPPGARARQRPALHPRRRRVGRLRRRGAGGGGEGGAAGRRSCLLVREPLHRRLAPREGDEVHPEEREGHQRLRVGPDPLAGELLPGRRQSGLQEVGGAAGDRLLPAVDQLAHIGVDRLRRSAEVAEAVVPDLLADGRVAIALEDVVDGLGGDHLGKRGDGWWVAELATHSGDLRLDVGEAIQGAALAELGDPVTHGGDREHAAEGGTVEAEEGGVERVRVEGGDLLEEVGHPDHRLDLQCGRVRGARKTRDHGLRGGQGGPAAQGRDADVGTRGAGVMGGPVGELGLAGLGAEAHRHRDSGGLDRGGDQCGGTRGAGRSQGVVKADGVAAEPGQRAGERRQGGHPGVRADHDPLDGGPRGPGGPDRGGQVGDVVERVEKPEDADARLRRELDEGLDNVVGKVAMADQHLTAQGGHQGGPGGGGRQGAQPCEGVLAEEAELSLEGGPAEDLQRGEATGVEELRRADGVPLAQPAEHESLLPVAKRGLDQLQTRHHRAIVWGMRPGRDRHQRPAGGRR